MKHLITLSFLLIFGPSFGQIYIRGYAPTYQPHAVTTDSNGNSYVCGTYYYGNNHDFNPDPNHTLNLPSTDAMFVQKFDKCGRLVWAKSFGGKISGAALAQNIEIDPFGSIYISGNYIISADFDPGPNTFMLNHSSGSYDMYILKLDANGDFLWANTYFTSGNSITVEEMATDSLGNLFGITWHIGGTVVGTSYNSLFKIDPSGNLLWSHDFSVDGSVGAKTFLTGVGVSSAGDAVICGLFKDTLSIKSLSGLVFDTATSNVGSQDLFYAKYNSNGEPQWLISYGGQTNSEFPSELEIDSLGFIYSAGTYQGLVDFDPGPNIFNLQSMNADSYVLKLSPLGNLVWAKSFGGTGTDWVHRTALGPNNELTITGHFTGTIDFDPGPGSAMASGLGGYSTKFDENGNFISNKVIPNILRFEDTHVDSRNHLYEIGSIKLGVDSIDLDPDLTEYWVRSHQPTSQLAAHFLSVSSDTSICEVISLEENFSEQFSIYPNPSDGRFFVTKDITLEARVIEIEVHNIHGKRVYKTRTFDPSFELDFKGEKGIYLLSLRSGNQRTSFKLVKS